MNFRVSKQTMPLLATIAATLLLYGVAAMRYDGFLSLGVFINFFADNAFLGIAAVGMTFVILSGGIDLSVGSMIGCGSVLIAALVQKKGLSPALAIPLVLFLGTAFGVLMGAIIHYFNQPPFLVTLAGMFFLRGLGLVVGMESIPIQNSAYTGFSAVALRLGEVSVPMTALVFLAVVAAGIYVSIYSRFGRNVYAVGGNEQSALLMGLPVGPTKLAVYGVSGFCSSLAAVVYTIYTLSGNPTAGVMLELDAIAAVVVGGTLLSGGVGTVFGTLLGVLIFGVIQTAIMFEGTLSSWWTRIAIGILLLAFILLQRVLQKK